MQYVLLAFSIFPMKDKSFPYILLFLAGIICLNLWSKNRRLKHKLYIAETKLSFTNANAGNSIYDSVYAKGKTVSFYKNGILVGSSATTTD